VLASKKSTKKEKKMRKTSSMLGSFNAEVNEDIEVTVNFGIRKQKRNFWGRNKKFCNNISRPVWAAGFDHVNYNAFRLFPKYRGFTIVELLVVIAIIGILVSLLMAAVQATREASRRINCQSRQRQIGLGLQMHVDVYQKFPCGVTMGFKPSPSNPHKTHSTEPDWCSPGKVKDVGTSAIGWGTRTLPFIEQVALYDAITQKFVDAGWSQNMVTNWDTSITEIVGTELRTKIIPTWICPSSPHVPIFDQGKGRMAARGNYVGLMGPWRAGRAERRDISTPGNYGGNTRDRSFDNRYRTLTEKQTSCDRGDYGGLFFQGHPEYEGSPGFQPGLNDISDGASNCLMISERDGAFANPSVGDRMATYWFGPGIPQAVTDITFSTYYPINDISRARGSSRGETPAHSCAASQHPGGVCVTFADGSGRFVSETIEKKVWRLLGDRADGEHVTLP
jgi:prepilin-type N-terminal cleavage/methylation domain-containing protein